MLPNFGVVLLALACSLAWGAEPQVVPVTPLTDAPTVDGNLTEWGGSGWIKIPVAPALTKADRDKYALEGEDRNATGSLTVQLRAGVAAGRIYLALRWPDDAADADYKGWEWNGSKYAEGKKRDDMFAIRFHKDGQFDRSMLTNRTYSVDVWLWSAARTNPSGLAEDWVHTISGKPIEDAVEYEAKGLGTVYIKKTRDAGTPIYRVLRAPKEKGAERLPSFELTGSASGSVADVSAKGVWRAGHWNLEMSRKLDTGQSDDVEFRPGQKLLAQIAVFNHGSDEHKSVSEPLLLDFSAVK